jgi:hypothetical protein
MTTPALTRAGMEPEARSGAVRAGNGRRGRPNAGRWRNDASYGVTVSGVTMPAA